MSAAEVSLLLPPMIATHGLPAADQEVSWPPSDPTIVNGQPASIINPTVSMMVTASAGGSTL